MTILYMYQFCSMNYQVLEMKKFLNLRMQSVLNGFINTGVSFRQAAQYIIYFFMIYTIQTVLFLLIN